MPKMYAPLETLNLMVDGIEGTADLICLIPDCSTETTPVPRTWTDYGSVIRLDSLMHLVAQHATLHAAKEEE